MAEYYGRQRRKLRLGLQQLIDVEVLRLLRQHQRRQMIPLEILHQDLKLQWRRAQIREDHRLRRQQIQRQPCYAGQLVVG